MNVYRSVNPGQIMYEGTIARFEAFLQERRLVPSERVRFYGHWVHRFLCFARDEGSSDFDGCFLRFSALLRDREDRPDWQVGQARDAVRIYYHQFRQAYPKPGPENGPKSTGSPSSSSVPTGMEAALERMKEELRLRGLSLKTEEAYLGWAGRFYRYRNSVGLGNRVPQPNDMKAFLTHLALEGNVSKSTQNQAFSGLLFLFRHVLNIDVDDLSETPRAKRGRRLPVALSPDETLALINAADGPEVRFTIELIYGTGMRLQEFCRLRVRDIDFDMKTIRVIAGKGDKDRTVMLPEHLADGLRARIDQAGEIHEHDLAQGYGEVWLPDALSRKYRSAARSFAWQYVFPSGKLSVDPRSGKVRRQHIHRCTIQRQVEAARKWNGKNVRPERSTPDTIEPVSSADRRYSPAESFRSVPAFDDRSPRPAGFAETADPQARVVYLLPGVNIGQVQDDPGHAGLETTIYTHVLQKTDPDDSSSPDDLRRHEVSAVYSSGFRESGGTR